MPCYRSEQFASSAASGKDWRVACKKVLAELEQMGVDKKSHNFGILYITDCLADEAASILTLFRSVTGIEDWVGGVGIGICALDTEYADEPAVAVMVGRFDPDDYRILPPVSLDMQDAKLAVGDWVDDKGAFFGLVHGDPLSDPDPAQILKNLGQ